MDDNRVPAQSKFLAHGAAAEVWLIDAPNPVDRKCVLKIIRLNLKTLKENYGLRGSKRAIQLWKDFTSVFRSKVDQWKPLAHINIVQVLDLNEGLDLRVDYLACGSASQYLAKHPRDSALLRRKMIPDVLAGLNYLHSQNPPIVHGCIRMDKLFVGADGTTKIGEFGLASLLGNFEFFAPSVSQVSQVRWTSPELLQGNTDQRPPPTTESDVWALGCTLFEITSGKLPYFKYKHDLRVRHEIVSKRTPGLRESLFHLDFMDVWDVITSCWEWDPKQRPSTKELVRSSRWPIGLASDELIPQASRTIDAYYRRSDDSNKWGTTPTLPQILDDDTTRPRDLIKNSDLPVHLAISGASYADRYERLGDLGDLEKAIEYESRALSLTPDDHPDMAMRLSNLAVSRRNRFQRLGELGDLEQAIKYQSRALALTPDDHSDIAMYLTNLALHRQTRFQRLGELGDLEQAIEYESRALSLTPDDHPDMAMRLSNLAVSHRNRFQRLGGLGDLEKAIKYQSRALSLTPDGHPHMAMRLSNLAVSHRNRFQRLGELGDLEQAIEYQSRALALTPDGHPDSCRWHFNHASSYIRYYEHSNDPSHLQESLASFRRACIPLTGAPRDRFMYACQWATHASKHSILNPIEAYQTAIDLLPQFIWLGTTTNKNEDIQMAETLAVDAGRAAILCSDYSRALEWLEQARSIIWNWSLMLRSPLDQLQASHPSLATLLQTVADELHNSASSTSRELLEAYSTSMTLEEVGKGHRHLAEQYLELLNQTRTLPGFGNFLQPIKSSEFSRAARNGPIVVINCHEDCCDALLVLPSQSHVAHLPLPNFTRTKAQNVRYDMESLIKLPRLRESRILQRTGEPERDDGFGSVLRTLWNDIVKPVLDFLGYMNFVGQESLPHITWCLTGVASFLPLHAAGNYDEPCLSILDYAISSYTPTLTALLASTPSTLGQDSRVLAIGQAATQGHIPLSNTKTELEYVKSWVGNKAEFSQLMDAQATPSAVLDAMEQHDWVHLACHTYPDAENPTGSGFFLNEGTLDLASINRRSFKNKGLAFLSACQNAIGDERLPKNPPDGAVHLASGMFMAGYPSVITTIWPTTNSDVPYMVDKVYAQLVKDGRVGDGEAGKALHDAVVELREKIGVKEFLRWVPYIHIGS